MKIIHVLNHFLPNHVAGTEVYALNLGKELENLGVKVVYFIPNYGNAQSEEYYYDGQRVIKYAEPSIVDRALQMGKRKPDGLKTFIEILKTEQPDIVHFHEIAGSNGITLSHVKAAKNLGYKVIMTFHLGRYTATSDSTYLPVDVFNIKAGSYNFYRNKGFGNTQAKMFFTIANFFRKMNLDVSGLGKTGTALSVPQLIEKKKNDFFELLENCDKAVTIARWYHDLLIKDKVDSKKLFFIEQGIIYASLPNAKEYIASAKLKVIFVGRISHFKGVRILLEAVKGLSVDKIQLDIYGDFGEDNQYILDCKKIAEGKSHIRFMGRLNPGESILKMADYDVLILPSTFSEMSPLVIREAFAAGISVLASDSMGSKEQIEDGKNGWLFKMNDVQDLTEKLKWLIEHPEKIREASQHVPPSRSFSMVAQEYLKLYRTILEEQSTVLNPQN